MTKARTILAVATLSKEECNKAPYFIQPISTLECVRKLLHYSWTDIGFEYEGLTKVEKGCITREQHAMLLPWVLTAYDEQDPPE